MHKDNKNSILPYWELRKTESTPLLDLCLAISCLRSCLARTTKDKQASLGQAIAFLELYKQQRGKCEEVLYNTARFAQGLGLNIAAQRTYDQLLSICQDQEIKVRAQYNLA